METLESTVTAGPGIRSVSFFHRFPLPHTTQEHDTLYTTHDTRRRHLCPDVSTFCPLASFHRRGLPSNPRKLYLRLCCFSGREFGRNALTKLCFESAALVLTCPLSPFAALGGVRLPFCPLQWGILRGHVRRRRPRARPLAHWRNSLSVQSNALAQLEVWTYPWNAQWLHLTH